MTEFCLTLYNFDMFYILLFLHFIDKETEGKTLFQNHFLRSKSLANAATPNALPGNQRWARAYQQTALPEVSQACLNLMPFCGPFNILAMYTDHPSLKILQYHFVASKESTTEAPSGSVI